jgi:hypothetical protein
MLDNFSFPELREGDNDKEVLRAFYDEILYDNEYARFGVEVEPGDVVIDCGANIGIFSRYARDIKGASKVYSFEGQEFWYNSLVENTKHDSNIVPHLGWITNSKTDSTCWDLYKILTTYNISKINFLKIDIECGEYGFIIDTPDELLKRVDKLAVEIHLGCSPDGVWVYKTLEKLSKCGFNLKFEWIHKELDVAMLYGKNETFL